MGFSENYGIILLLFMKHYAVVTHYNHTAKTILMSTKIYGEFLFFSSFLNKMKEKNSHF